MENLKETYSFTLTIDGKKLVYYSGKRRRYGNMRQDHQAIFLNSLIIKVLRVLYVESYEWVFEEHADKRLHVHGIMTFIDSKQYNIESFISDFYTHNQIVGYKFSTYSKLSKYERTIVDTKFWLDYMRKHQKNLILRQYTQDIEFSRAVDDGVIRECKFREEYPDDYWKTYRFGQNLFKIEI